MQDHINKCILQNLENVSKAGWEIVFLFLGMRFLRHSRGETLADVCVLPPRPGRPQPGKGRVRLGVAIHGVLRFYSACEIR